MNSALRVPAPLNDSTNLIQLQPIKIRGISVVNDKIENLLFAYPNPANETLTVLVAYENGKEFECFFEVYNSLGQIVLEFNYFSPIAS